MCYYSNRKNMQRREIIAGLHSVISEYDKSLNAVFCRKGRATNENQAVCFYCSAGNDA